METDALTQLIIEYRYWILIPLSLIEGPIVALAAGTLASAGYFNPIVLEVIFVARDLVTDLFYYYVGVYAKTTRLVQWFLKKIGVTPEHLGKAKSLWERHAVKTMFLGKLSYGIAPSFFIVAGMIRISLKRFIALNAIIASLQYGVCLALGYALGNVLGGSIVSIMNKLQVVISVLILALVVAYAIRFYSSWRLLKEEEKEPDQP